MSEPILIIVENESVPFDSRVWKEARSLHEEGYTVTVLCPKRKGYTRSHEILEGVHIYRHPTPPEGNSPLGYLLEFSSALLWEFLFSWWIYFRRGFRVIQGCNPPDTIFLVALPFKLFGVKYIFDHHDANPELYLAKYARKDFLYRTQIILEKLTYRFSDVVMATNLSYKALAVNRGGLNPDNVFVVRNGPDLESFKAVTPKPALKNGKQYLIGYVGTMALQDGLDILLDVALYIRNKGRRDVHFTCVGGGPALAQLRELVKTKDLAGMVNFTGRIPDEDLMEVLSTADICVNPDKPCEMNDISTMIKIMEYMALGKPIVQFDLKEGRFSAQDASLYADPDNPVADFAEKLLWLVENPGARQIMGDQGLRRVNQELAWKYSVPNLLAAYKKALGKSARAAATLSTGKLAKLPLESRVYYSLRPVIPRRIQLRARQWRAPYQRRGAAAWPVSEDAGNAPPGWPGWPGGKRFAIVLTHDVEREAGVVLCNKLADAEEHRGLRSAFGFVPLRYDTPQALLQSLRCRGFEIMVHDLHHNGKLFRDPKIFAEEGSAVNEFLKQWQSRGFSAGSMHHNLPWISRMELDYSVSTYDVDPFEPQACGSNRIFPYWVQAPDSQAHGYVEMPYTLPQDFTLFVLLKERTDAIWRQKLDWIAEKGGMALIKTHPDYMIFPGERPRADGYAASLYTGLLDYITSRYGNEAWFAQPSEVARYWRSLRTTAENPIEWSKTFCASCRQAHRDGWLRHSVLRCRIPNSPADERDLATTATPDTAAVYRIDPLTDPRWAALVDKDSRSSVFHSVNWLQALYRTYGFQPVVFTTSPPGVELSNGLLFCYVTSWITGKRLISVPFSDHCEILADTPAGAQTLMKLVAEMPRRESLRYVEIRPRSPLSGPAEACLSTRNYCFHELDLGPSLDTLFAKFHRSSTQRKILRAEREGLVYRCERSTKLFEAFWNLLLITRRRHGLPPQPKLWFQHLIDLFGEALQIRVAFHGPLPAAAILTIRHQSTLVYKYGCSDTRLNHLGGTQLLFWKAIQEGKHDGLRMFDLGRSDSGNTGLITFKNRFGATCSTLTYSRFSAAADSGAFSPTGLGSAGRITKRAISLLPDGLLRLAGAILYRHIP